MHNVKLRKVGGSVMLAVPPSILELLDMKAGSSVDLAVEGSRLVIEPRERPRYTLDELLAQCDSSQEMDDGEKVWLRSAPEGGELI